MLMLLAAELQAAAEVCVVVGRKKALQSRRERERDSYEACSAAKGEM